MDASGFQDLLKRAQTGEPDAVEQLLLRVRPFAEQVARKYADPARIVQSTSDLVQDAEVKAWQQLEGFTGGESDDETLARFNGWLTQIVRRLGVDAHRRRNRQRRKDPDRAVVSFDRQDEDGARNEPPGGVSTPSAKVSTAERAQLLLDAIEKIPDSTHREVVRLYFFEDVSFNQIAKRLELPYSRVRDIYDTTMRRLGRQLGHIE